MAPVALMPSARSWHAAAVVSGGKVLLHGGLPAEGSPDEPSTVLGSVFFGVLVCLLIFFSFFFSLFFSLRADDFWLFDPQVEHWTFLGHCPSMQAYGFLFFFVVI